MVLESIKLQRYFLLNRENYNFYPMALYFYLKAFGVHFLFCFLLFVCFLCFAIVVLFVYATDYAVISCPLPMSMKIFLKILLQLVELIQPVFNREVFIHIKNEISYDSFLNYKQKPISTSKIYKRK